MFESLGEGAKIKSSGVKPLLHRQGFWSGGDCAAGAGGVGFCVELPAEVRDFAK